MPSSAVECLPCAPPLRAPAGAQSRKQEHKMRPGGGGSKHASLGVCRWMGQEALAHNAQVDYEGEGAFMECLTERSETNP